MLHENKPGKVLRELGRGFVVGLVGLNVLSRNNYYRSVIVFHNDVANGFLASETYPRVAVLNREKSKISC